MNETVNNILSRHSVRNFNPKKLIEDDKIEAIINSGLSSPNSGNIQAWKVIVVKNQEIKVNLMRVALNQVFIIEAPIVSFNIRKLK